jgi:hypothetical protein
MKKQIKKIVLCIAILVMYKSGSSQIINTIAGNGASGYTGDGSLAINAKLDSPDHLCLDALGNIYFSDKANNRIRMVNVSTGIISLVAGDGTQSFNGDGGLATQAQLNSPSGIALDGLGNLLFADFGNYRIRKINLSTGIINTVYGAGIYGSSGDGGLASNANITAEDIKFDASGNLLVSEPNFHRVRKIVTSTGIINTIAGIGTSGYTGDGGLAVNAQLFYPMTLSLDNIGNIYIADMGNHMIRKVTLSSGIINSICGNGAAGFSGDGGLSSTAQLNMPTGIFVDASNNVFIRDGSNYRIRKIDYSTGIINTVVGTGVAGFSGDGGPAISAQINIGSASGLFIDAIGNLYFPDQNRIRKVTASSTSIYESIADVNQLIAFPNPTSDQLNISGLNASQKSISITNVIGEVVKTSETNGSQSLTVDIKNLSPGVYFIVSNNKALKFIKE